MTRVNCVVSFAQAPDWRNFKHFCKHVTTSLSSACTSYSCLAAIPWLSSLVLTDKQSNAVKCPRKGNTGGTSVHVQSCSVCFLSSSFCFVFFRFVIFKQNLFSWRSSHLSYPFGSPCFHLSPCFRTLVGPFLLSMLCFGKDAVDSIPWKCFPYTKVGC